MTRSGIKRGLAVSAVSALSIVGLPAAAHAAPVVNYVTATAASSSVQAYQTTTISGTVLGADDKTPVATGTAVNVFLTETVPAVIDTPADNTTSPVTPATYVNPLPGTETSAVVSADGKSVTFTNVVSTVTDAKGAYKVIVDSKVGGSLAVKVNAGTGLANTTVTVAGSGSQNANDATKLALANNAVNVYEYSAGDLADAAQFSVKSTDGTNGVFVVADGAKGGAWAIAKSSSPTTPVATGSWASTVAVGSDPYSTSVDLTDAIEGADLSAGGYVVEFWVNHDNGATSSLAPDAGEPTAIGTLNIIDLPDAEVLTKADGGKYESGLKHYGTATAFTGDDDATNNVLPAGEAATIPLATQVWTGDLNSDGKPVFPAAGAKFSFDVKVSTSAGGTVVKSARVPATYDAATGLVTASYVVSKDDASDNNIVQARLVLSQDQNADDYGVNGETVRTLGRVSTFDARAVGITQPAGSSSTVQATVGGAVSIPVVVADQFGKAVQGDVLRYVVSNDNAITTTTAATDASGRTTITYTDKSATTVAGTSVDYVNATDVTTSDVAPLGQVTVKYIAGTTAPAAITDGTATGKPVDPNKTNNVALDTNGAYKTNLTVAAAGNSYVYSFVVVNAKGEPLSNQAVTLSASAGGLVTDTVSHKTGASLTVMTDADGAVDNIKLGSKKVGTVALTVASGAASYSFTPIEVTTAGAPYSVVPVTAPQKVVPGNSAKFVFQITDEWGNPVEGQHVGFSLGSNTNPGTLDISSGFFGSASDKNGNVVAVVNTSSNEAGTGSVVATPGWTPSKAADSDGATATFTDAKGVSIAYTVAAPVTHPTAAEQKLGTDTAKLSKDKAALASATAKLSKDRAKLAKDKKALKHAKGHKKAHLKKVVKKLKKAISADKKAVSAANRAISADNKAIAADKAAIAAGK